MLEGCCLGWTWSGGRGKDLRLWDDPCVLLLTGGSDICWGRTYRRSRKGTCIDRKAMAELGSMTSFCDI